RLERGVVVTRDERGHDRHDVEQDDHDQPGNCQLVLAKPAQGRAPIGHRRRGLGKFARVSPALRRQVGASFLPGDHHAVVPPSDTLGSTSAYTTSTKTLITMTAAPAISVTARMTG